MTSPGDRGEFELTGETAVCADVKMSLASRFTAQQFFQRQDRAVFASCAGCTLRSPFACDDIILLYFLSWGISWELASACVLRRGACLIYLVSLLKYLSAASCKIHQSSKKSLKWLSVGVFQLHFLIPTCECAHLLNHSDRQVPPAVVVTGSSRGLLQQKGKGIWTALKITSDKTSHLITVSGIIRQT